MSGARIKVANLPSAPKPTKAVKIYDDELSRLRSTAKNKAITGLAGNLTWGEEDDARLIELKHKGWGAPQISVRMHRSVGCIKRRLDYLRKIGKLKRSTHCIKPWTTEEEKHLITAYKGGQSVTDICADLDRSKNSVEHRLEKLCQAGEITMRPHGRMRKEKTK